MTTVSIDVVVSKDLEQVRSRLGNTGMIRAAMGDVLDEGARIGEQSAKIYAPSTPRRGIIGAISSHPASRTTTGALEARVGVGRVPEAYGSPDYPFFVHAGTGLFGKKGQLIRPKRASHMVFAGRTGIMRLKTTRGQKPQPYMNSAFVDVNEYIRQRIDGMVRRIIEGR